MPATPGASNNKLTLDYGLRWDYYSPSSEKNDRLSFFDPTGANPGAGGRPGRLAFAGDATVPPATATAIPKKTGTAGSRRVSAPCTRSTTRQSSAAAGASSTRRRSIPAGAAACARTGSRTTPAFNTSLGGIQPAMYLDQGFPQNFAPPPIIRSDYQERPGICLPPDRRQQAAVLAPVEHHGGSRARPQHVAERGVRRQRRPPDAVEHGSR